MPSPRERQSLDNESGTRSHDRQVLLDEVKFKWHMTGLGLWIDMGRFRTDLAYAAQFLEIAQTSGCIELRNCAAALRTQSAKRSH